MSPTQPIHFGTTTVLSQSARKLQRRALEESQKKQQPVAIATGEEPGDLLMLTGDELVTAAKTIIDNPEQSEFTLPGSGTIIRQLRITVGSIIPERFSFIKPCAERDQRIAEAAHRGKYTVFALPDDRNIFDIEIFQHVMKNAPEDKRPTLDGTFSPENVARLAEIDRQEKERDLANMEAAQRIENLTLESFQ